MNTDIQSKQSPLYCAVKFPIMRVPLLRPLIGIVLRGHSTTTWTEFCRFLPPPPCVDSSYTLGVDKNRYFLTPSPHLVHVVIEWPLTYLKIQQTTVIFSKYFLLGF